MGSQVAPSLLRHGAARLFGRDGEMAALDEAWRDPDTHVLTVVAWGGVGKTALVAAWAAALAERGHDGARSFAWSFYSQGTREDGGASADEFVAAALEFFGDAKRARGGGSPWSKGARLAKLVAQERTLLVLDGIEPLQYPPGPLAGELRDPALAALLRGLARHNPGLCIVTTRERVADLEPYRDSTAPELALHHLSVPAGIDLLRSLGVRGSDAELERLVEDVRGHALTLHLVGGYLAHAHGGDIGKRGQVDLAAADAAVQGGHAFKAMAAYERWLSAPDTVGRTWWPLRLFVGWDRERAARQLAALRLLGLFDRPADARSLAALRKPPAIPGLTEPLVRMDEAEWNRTVDDLAAYGLVSARDEVTGLQAEAIDAHPLVREYFAARLREGSPEAWRSAHARLYHHLKDRATRWPDTLADLQPLYQAVAHGCLADKHLEALTDVYRDRILRGTDQNHSTHRLGAYGTDLGAVARFFEQQWSRVHPSIPEAPRAWLFNEAAVRLRALGRLGEALEPMRAGLRARVEMEDWLNAATAAGNLSELRLALGEVAAAVADAEQAVAHADRSGDMFERYSKRTTLADALHLAGRRDEALALFREAEAMLASEPPGFPVLYSLWGARYCDLLLADAERAAWRLTLARKQPSQPHVDRDADPPLLAACQAVEQRAAMALRVAEAGGDSLLDPPLHHLTLGRAALCGAILRAAGSRDGVHAFAEAEEAEPARQHLGTAVGGLRRAGDVEFVVRGLLSRAWLRRLDRDSAGARADLDEATEIAARGRMRLHLADIHLYRARLFHATEPYPWGDPLADLAAARTLVEQCGYGRRQEELADAATAAKDG